MMLLDSDSEEEGGTSRRGVSLQGKSPNINRNRQAAAIKLHNDYFSDSPVYTPRHFLRRVLVSMSVFNRIIQYIAVHDPYFT